MKNDSAQLTCSLVLAPTGHGDELTQPSLSQLSRVFSLSLSKMSFSGILYPWNKVYRIGFCSLQKNPVS